MENSQKKPEKLIELDVLKALAILAVVLIHVVSLSYGNFTKWAWSFESLFTLDQLTRFSVPMFVTLSGLGLGMSNLNRAMNFGSFLKRRVWKLLPWYLTASLAIFLFIQNSSEWEHVEHFPIWRLVVEGKADYHLYFVPMIVQLYILFPFIKTLLRRYGKYVVFGALAVTSLIIFVTTLDAEKYLSLPFAWGDQQQYLFFGTWIFYFVLGVYLNFVMTFSSRRAKVFRCLGWIFLVAGMLIVVADGFRLLAAGADLNEATRFTRFSVLLYATGVIMTAFSYRRVFIKFPNIFVWIGERSYLIYLFHTLVIRVSLDIFKPHDLLSMTILFLCVFMLSAVLAEGLYRAGLGLRLSKKIFKNANILDS